MKRNLFYTLIIIGLFIPVSVVTGQDISKETRNLKGFTKVSLGIAGDLKIKIGPEFSVILEGTKTDLEQVVTEVSGEKLLIKQDSWRYHFKEKVSVFVTMPSMTGLSVSGSGRAEILDAIKNADNLNLNVSGSGNLITTGLVVDELNCDISGSGNISIKSEGSADRGDITISGSGGYSGESMKIDHLNVNISGSGHCLCKAGDSLTASISGSGNVAYVGDPKIDAHVSGSGHVRSYNK